MRVTLTDARAVSTYNETVVRLYVHTLGGTCCTHACISCKCCTYMYLLQVFHHMHVPLASVAHACTCDETVVRPGFEEELPPSSPLQATHKNFHRLLHHHHTNVVVLSLSSFLRVLFSHLLIRAYFSVAQSQPQSSLKLCSIAPQMFYISTSFLFLHNISALFLLKQIEIEHHRSHTLIITLKNYYLASLYCCYYYMSFQHICKLYTCWLRLILYLIKQI